MTPYLFSQDLQTYFWQLVTYGLVLMMNVYALQQLAIELSMSQEGGDSELRERIRKRLTNPPVKCLKKAISLWAISRARGHVSAFAQGTQCPAQHHEGR